MVRPRVPIAALAIGIALAGCGAEEEGADAFRDGYNRVIAEAAEVSTDLERADPADQSNREIAADFKRVADTWESTRARLSRLSPPEEARYEFERLLEALEEGVDDLRGAARAANASNPDRFAEAESSLSESSEDIDRAEEALKNAVGG
jgi:hypothetical protein